MTIYTVEMEEPPDDTPCECGGCNWTGTFAEVDEIGECSLTPGDPSPCGRCPTADCGSLVYPIEDSTKWKWSARL
jgi:hypothetical protein